MEEKEVHNEGFMQYVKKVKVRSFIYISTPFESYVY